MKSSTSLRLLLIAAVAAPTLAFWPDSEQGADKVDWAKHVRKACESRRFGIRLAAAKKVAAGGDAAIAAINAYAQQNGANSLPSSLVDAIADSQQNGEGVRRLLTDWVRNDDFYWRSLAMRGMALRAPNTLARKQPTVTLESLFKGYRNDAAWLMRTHARLGIRLLDIQKADEFGEPELDPRARVRLASLLLKSGITPQLQPLFDALADQRTFLGTPWGPRLGQESFKALKRWLGEDLPTIDPASPKATTAALRKAAAKKSGQSIHLPTPQTDSVTGIVGGIEILSCKFGDQFVQWTTDGAVFFGIDASRQTNLPAKAWEELSKQQTAMALESDVGVVICDSLRVRLVAPKTHIKVAPKSLPKPASEWLKRLAQRLEEANEAEIATNLNRGLGQFVGL